MVAGRGRHILSASGTSAPLGRLAYRVKGDDGITKRSRRVNLLRGVAFLKLGGRSVGERLDQDVVSARLSG